MLQGVLQRVKSHHLRLALLLVVTKAIAQTPGAGDPAQLPSAPEPNLQASASPRAEWSIIGTPSSGDRSGASKNPAPDPPSTMFPHPEDSRYWLSGQANIIFQGRLPFHSPYEGPNSFRNSAEYKTSLVGTLFTAVRPNRSVRFNTDFILDVESSGGRGLSRETFQPLS